MWWQVIERPAELLETVVGAALATGMRVILQSGWTTFETARDDLPPHVHIVGNCPHDWLFLRVAAVVHHGGAGTVAAGLRAGKPTLVCPFFGDQFFWGAMVARCGAGPPPVPVLQLTSAKLAQAVHVHAHVVHVTTTCTHGRCPPSLCTLA